MILGAGESSFATTRDGRSLHCVSAGSAAPTVVFESGMGRAAVRQQSFFARALPFAARTGLLRFGVRRIVEAVPRDFADAIVAESATLDAARTFRSELEPFVGDLRELRDASPKDPDVPMTVVSGTLRPRFGAAIRSSIVEAHARRASMLPRGRHVRAERSGHYVMLTEPELVAREILDVVASVRSAPTR